MEAIFLIGIQGSGKSHFYRQRFFRTHVRLSLDLLRTRSRFEKFLQTCLETKQRFVVDNTNATVEERRPYLELIRRGNFKTVAYFFEPDVAAALKRNESRPQPERIPKVGIFATRKRLQRPLFEEGFMEIHSVQIDSETSEFIINETATPTIPESAGESSTKRISSDFR